MDIRSLLNIILALVIILLLIAGGGKDTVADFFVSIFNNDVTSIGSHDQSNKKRSFGPKVAIYPEPAMVIASYGKDDIPNAMSASWFGIANTKPFKIAVSLRPDTLTYQNVMKNMAFTVNVPDDTLSSFVSFVGKYSGKDINKFEITGFTAVKGEYVNAPYIEEFPIILECVVTEYHDLGSHRQFIGEVIDTKIDEKILNRKGHVDFEAFKPLLVGQGGYYRGGSFVGKGKDLRKVFEKRMNAESMQ
jgi:flavin reductase (DIM6/NTAB) family NADH-FMN oxidoreductase RutF